MTEGIQFTDGEAYERYMGVWSQLAGNKFLDWLAPAPQQRWLDVGCGNGAFTALLLERCHPASVDGIDPSPEQLAFARTRLELHAVRLTPGDAMALTYPDHAFDAAVMPLVIFFVPDPARGVAEMVRVTRPGGLVTAYGWDLQGGGFPYEILRNALIDSGVEVPSPPSPDAAGLEELTRLWTDAGLQDVATQEITVHRSFDDFDDWWTTVLGAPSVGGQLLGLDEAGQRDLKAMMRAQLPADDRGRITTTARANAVRGRVPG